MTKRIDPKVAEKIMLKAGLKPLESYKNNHSRWKSQCIKCKNLVHPVLSSLKRGSKGCKKCADKSNGLKRRIKPEDAVKIMLKAKLKPIEKFQTNSTKWKCKCLKCGKIVEPTLKQIKEGSKCAYCAGNRIDTKEAIEKMLQANLFPLEPYKDSKSKWKCRCVTCTKIVFPMFTHVNAGIGGCKYCGHEKTANKLKLPERSAIKVMTNSSMKPLEPYKNMNTKWKSLCLICNNIGYPTLAQIKSGKGGCRPCGYKSGSSKTRKKESIAKEVMIASNVQPLEPYRNSNSKWKCRCLICSKTVYPRLSSIIQGQGGCEYCSGKKVDIDEAYNVFVSAGVKPLTPYVRSNQRWKSECLKCKRIVYPTYSNIKGGKGACGYCSQRIVNPKDAEKIMKKAFLSPIDPYPGTNKRWKCQCLKCKKTVYPTYSHVKNGHTGCIYCAPAGLDLRKASYLYLITNQNLNAHKVGIGNIRLHNDRVKQFNKKGWVTYQTWNVESGKMALVMEKEVFRILRKDMKFPIYLTKSEMPITGGHAETIDADAITLLALEKIIKKVIKGYRNTP